MIKHLYKYIAIIVIAIIFSSGFVGANNIQSVDDLAYAVAIGIDVGETERIKVTFQFTMPNSSGENNAGETAPAVIDTVEAACIDSAVNLVNTFVSKEVNLSHCKVIVISEELARSGISKEIYSLMNKVQVRPDSNVIISTTTAQEYIESVKPGLENLVAKFYEILPRSSEYTGFTSDIQLIDFFRNLESKATEPVAILGHAVSASITGTSTSSSGSGGGNASSEGSVPSQSTAGQGGGESGTQPQGQAGQSGQGGTQQQGQTGQTGQGGQGGTQQQGQGGASQGQGDSGSGGQGGGSEESGSGKKDNLPADNGIENVGLAVFKDDKMVGTLSKTETLSHLIITNKLKSCRLSIPDPEDETKAIDFFLTADSKPKIKVSILNGTPYISIDVKMNGRISSINQISEDISDERITEIERYASHYLETHISNYLYKTSKEFNSDISGLGQYAIGNFKTRSEFEEYNWLDNFDNAFFNVNTEVKVRSNFLLIGT